MFRHDHELTTRDLIGLGFWAVLEEVHHLKREIRQMALDLTQLTADVQADTDAVNSAVLLLNTLAQEIRDNADDPTALNELAAKLEQNTTALAQAVTDNTNPVPPDTTGTGANVGQVPVTPEVVDPTNLNNTPADADPSDPEAAGTAQPAPEPETVPEEAPLA